MIVGGARGQEIQFLFQALASGLGALLTLYGDSVESAVPRMISEQPNVVRARLMLAWSFLQVDRVGLESVVVVRRARVSKGG